MKQSQSGLNRFFQDFFDELKLKVQVIQAINQIVQLSLHKLFLTKDSANIRMINFDVFLPCRLIHCAVAPFCVRRLPE